MVKITLSRTGHAFPTDRIVLLLIVAKRKLLDGAVGHPKEQTCLESHGLDLGLSQATDDSLARKCHPGLGVKHLVGVDVPGWWIREDFVSNSDKYRTLVVIRARADPDALTNHLIGVPVDHRQPAFCVACVHHFEHFNGASTPFSGESTVEVGIALDLDVLVTSYCRRISKLFFVCGLNRKLLVLRFRIEFHEVV